MLGGAPALLPPRVALRQLDGALAAHRPVGEVFSHRGRGTRSWGVRASRNGGRRDGSHELRWVGLGRARVYVNCALYGNIANAHGCRDLPHAAAAGGARQRSGEARGDKVGRPLQVHPSRGVLQVIWRVIVRRAWLARFFAGDRFALRSGNNVIMASLLPGVPVCVESHVFVRCNAYRFAPRRPADLELV